MQAEDAHLEMAEDKDDSDEESDNEMGGSDAENSNDETVYERKIQRGGRARAILGIC